MGILTGDYGHEDRYVNGAAAQNGRYNTTKHVAAQCKDSDNKRERRESRKQTVGKVLGVFDRLGR